MRRAARRAGALRRLLGVAVPAGLGLGLGLALGTAPGQGLERSAGPGHDGADVAPAAVGAQDERWSFPEPIEVRADAVALDAAPRIARDRAGRLHAVWLASTGGAGAEIAYARREPGGAWSSPEPVTAADGVPRDAPSLAISSMGHVHVVWVERRGHTTFVAHRARDRASGVWSAVEHVDPAYAPVGQGEPAIAADPWGQVHVVWTDRRAGTADVYHSRRTPEGEWSPGAPINNPLLGDQRAPSLTVSPSGDLYAAWEDTRDGPVRIVAARMPPGGLVWWPNALLSVGEGGRPQRGVSIAAGGDGAIHAAWVDVEASVLRAATLRPDEPFWAADRAIYAAQRGPLRDVALAAGPADLVAVAWGEDRDEGARIYAAVLRDSLAPERVDGAPQHGDGRTPALVLGADGLAHALWTALPTVGARTVLHGSRRLPIPPWPFEAAAGVVGFAPLRPNCHRDGFVLRDCEGAVTRFVADESVDLAPFLGSWVAVDGEAIEEAGCSRLAVRAVRLAASPCQTSLAGIAGSVVADGRPVDAAVIELASGRALSGPSGRFYLGGIEPGTHAITSTARCALDAAIPGLSLGPRQLVQLPPARAALGDVNADCRIDVRDLVAVGARYRQPADPARPCLDLDRDGVVDLGDLARVASRLGLVCPQPWSPTPAPTALDLVSAPTPPAPPVDSAGR